MTKFHQDRTEERRRNLEIEKMNKKLKSEETQTSPMNRLASVSEQYRSSILAESDNSYVSALSTVQFLTSRKRNVRESSDESLEKTQKKKLCPNTHQLPMFLSKTYHLIDRCDPEIATWSSSGDSFVIKNVDHFAAYVLPKYFKHSNFSSFARQLNIYGFRKLTAEPILSADFDARTANYVSFYHEKFKRESPELMKDIKRATKSDHQSKDDMCSLKTEIVHLKEIITRMSNEYDRKLAEMKFEFNQKVTRLSFLRI